MRDIKFRCWDRNEKKIISWEILQYNQTAFMNSLRSIGDWIPMQYIGLEDKNGEEIYEGDILATKNKRWGFVHKNVVEWVDYDSQGYEDGESFVGFCKLLENEEVIGNIYENKDLIK